MVGGIRLFTTFKCIIYYYYCSINFKLLAKIGASEKILLILVIVYIRIDGVNNAT